ncbi:hypothetical protein Lal_00014663 [Lupinus albus]|nr:hypothetical protein Lal_00014663 [Lupinus albus]
MIRGLFTNKTVRNLLAADIPAGSTIHAGTGEILPLWDVAQRYEAEGKSVVVMAGERYGMGSSRDWAAKGVALLGVRAVLATSFERIHRWNLIGMGVLPLRLPEGLKPAQLEMTARDTITVDADVLSIAPRCAIPVTITRPNGVSISFEASAAIETRAEIAILCAGGVLPLILERLHRPSGERQRA